MDKLLNSINTRVNYLTSNSTNTFILKQCSVIRTKMKDIKAKNIKTKEVLDNYCDNIINRDIDLMKRVITDETNMVYKKMDELAGFIADIKTVYFEE